MNVSSQGRAHGRLPRLAVHAEYIKDFSIRNPCAPQSLAHQSLVPQSLPPPLAPCIQPTVNVQVDVSARPLSAVDVEVELRLDGECSEPVGTRAVRYRFVLAYAGIFGTQEIPRESLHSVVMIEAPRLLFPAAREIVAFMVGSAGFPPLLIEPVDFAELYQRRAVREAAPAGRPVH
jgi:preprotein translocase subunit SecB